MIATLFKAAIIAAIVVAITGAIGLFVMSGIAITHDVVPIPVPSSSYLATYREKSAYVNAFRAPMEFNSYRDIQRVADGAFYRGKREVSRTDKEVVYEGEWCGLHYYLAYMLEATTNPNTLTVITAVDVQNKKGRYAWKVVRPIQRRVFPFLLDRMAQLAPD